MKKQQGFIITLELILITSILGIGLFVGFAAIRDALFKYYVNQSSKEIVVSDAADTVLGKAIGFDEHEAPLIYYIDRSQEANYRALIGIRDDRFTSREPVYYTQPNCQGDPCMKAPSAELMDNRGVDGIPGSGAVAYLYALQKGPTYAIGRSRNGIPGFLYRQGVEACPVDNVTALTGSRYISQKVVHGEPCESPFPLPLPTGQAPRVCSGIYGSPSCPNTGPTACGVEVQTGECGCPVGYYDGADLLGLGIGQCCPTGTTATSDGTIGNTVLCRGAGLTKAISVPHPDDPAQNALETLTPPFSVQLPSDNDADSWVHIPPDGESGTQELNQIQ